MLSRWKVSASLKPLLRQKTSAAGLPHRLPTSRQKDTGSPNGCGNKKFRVTVTGPRLSIVEAEAEGLDSLDVGMLIRVESPASRVAAPIILNIFPTIFAHYPTVVEPR
jgi:hypothetical protein